MNLVEALTMAETALDRELNGDEVTLVARMVDAGQDAADILSMLDRPVEIVSEPQAEKVFLYEAVGNGVVPIPVTVTEPVVDDEGEPVHEDLREA